jgi:Chromo (CHRromatin Organisation MOdifier) domain
MMGYEQKAIPLPYMKTNVPEIEKRIIFLQKARDEALATHELTRQMVSEQVHRNFSLFKQGQKVWLEAKNLKTTHPSRKLALKCQGPFVIKEVLNPLNYWLIFPRQWKIHPVFHVALLTPYHETDTHRLNFPELPLHLMEGEKEYEVEAIIVHKRKVHGYNYLIKWKGYATSENSWEPEQNLSNTKKLLTEDKKKRKL